MINGTPATTPVAGDTGSPTELDDIDAVLALLRETMGNLDALLATVEDVPDPAVAE